MAEQRPGCAACFSSLSPDTGDIAVVVSLACSACRALHHPECWSGSGCCSRCGHPSAEPADVQVEPLAALPTAKAALQLRPLKTVYLLNSFALSERVLWYCSACMVVVVLGLIFGFPFLLSAIGQVGLSLARTESPMAPPEASAVAATPQPAAATQSVSVAPSPTVVQPGLARIRITDVHLRGGPGPNTSSVVILPRGTIVEVLGEVQPYEDNLWVRIRAGSEYGWVNQRYLLPGAPTAGARARVSGVKPAPLLLRREPSQRAEIIDRLNEDAEVELLDSQRQNSGITWQRVRIDEREGWVNGSYLQPIP